jgi:hypothetical protein
VAAKSINFVGALGPNVITTKMSGTKVCLLQTNIASSMAVNGFDKARVRRWLCRQR